MYLHNSIILVFLLVLWCCTFICFGGCVKVSGVQNIKYNQNDEVKINITFTNIPNNVKPKLFYSDNHLELDPFLQYTLKNERNGTYITAVYNDGGTNFTAKVLQYEFIPEEISEDDKHPCLQDYGCEIIISKWYKKRHEYKGEQLIYYHSNDRIDAYIILENEANDVGQRTLRETGNVVERNVNATMFYTKNLTADLNQTKLYVEASDRLTNLCYKRNIITYIQMENNKTFPNGRHGCLSSCTITINVDERDKNCNGSKVYTTTGKNLDEKGITKLDVATYNTTGKGSNEKIANPPVSSNMIITICVSVSLFIILIIIAYKCFKHVKKLKRNANEETYTYVANNQLLYTDLQFDSPKLGIPKPTYATSYTRIIGVLKRK